MYDVNHSQSGLTILTIEDLRDVVEKACNFELDDEFIPIFLFRRLDVNEVMEATLEPATPAVETRLEEVFQALQWDDRISLYQHLSVIAAARQIAGFVFGLLAWSIPPQGVMLTLVPMEKRSPPVEGGKRIQWELASNRTDRSDRSLAASPVSIYFPPSQVVELDARLTPAVASGFEPNRLYVPKKSTTNRAAFDAFIISGGFLHIFQIATMSLYEFESKSVYAINDGIKDFFFEEISRALPPKTMWRFVFVVPPRKRIVGQCKSSVGEFLTGVALFSAELDVEQWEPMA